MKDNNDIKNITFTNPLSVNGAADPFVTYTDGFYCATYTECSRITLFRSRSLDTVIKDEKRVIFTLCDEVQGNIWAPEFHFNPLDNRWYVYACGTTKGSDFSSMRMFCLRSEKDELFGDYSFMGYTDSDTLAIDQTIYTDADTGNIYTAFSEFTEDGQVITLAAMDGPSRVSERRIRLSYPMYDWEKRGPAPDKDPRVNEGPIFLCHDGKLSLVYSASGCWSRWYCLGLVEYMGADMEPGSVLDPANWKKHSRPIFSEGNGVYGVGHCSFFDTPDNKKWIAYHGMADPGAGEDGRFMYVQPIAFDEKNLPVIGEPIPRTQDIPLPAH